MPITRNINAGLSLKQTNEIPRIPAESTSVKEGSPVGW
ncbi:predicted protein [Botrytis cinerea T4]|uniref:Uncharacterized protein n=1 Tax=Botryotinia fuckeliana (strain T4) TaxID=999810 RepID=G2YP04_BOTF4|nr:predicted protein [Botrytis cinerea T4]